MALYIHPENQQLLWKIANKNPMIQEYFAFYPQNIQETWFKQIISSFYEQNRNNVSTSEQLYEINKNTLAYMVKDIKRNVTHAQQQTQQQQQPQTLATPNDFLRPYSVTENKEDKFTSQYNQLQNNYNTMFEKKIPESIDFREKITDQPISQNMEDLVQKHLRERDEELKRYAPTPFFGNQILPNAPQISSVPENFIPQRTSNFVDNNPPRLIIDHNNVQITVEELKDTNISSSSVDFSAGKIYEGSGVSYATEGYSSNSPPRRKNPEEIILTDNTNKSDNMVKWLDNENSDKIQSLEQEIIILKNQVLQMSDKISFLINVNKDIFDFSAQRLKMSNITISGGFLFDPPDCSLI
jgi:hypothetical protein